MSGNTKTLAEAEIAGCPGRVEFSCRNSRNLNIYETGLAQPKR
jgi:hypothetical protein